MAGNDAWRRNPIFQSGHPFYGNQFIGSAGAFPAGRGGLIHVSIDFAPFRKMLTGIAEDTKRGEPAMYEAMRRISMDLMQSQQRILRERIAETGREQRGTQYLLKAIVSEHNRKINVDGVTVGFLDEAWSHVSAYYRGLEYGTHVHTTAESGLTLRGVWITKGGFRPPEPGGLDAIGFRGRYLDHGGFPILRPIPAYEYQTAGTREWLTSGSGNPRNALAVMSKAFDEFGVNWMARFTRATGRDPQSTDVQVQLAGIAPLNG